MQQEKLIREQNGETIEDHEERELEGEYFWELHKATLKHKRATTKKRVFKDDCRHKRNVQSGSRQPWLFAQIFRSRDSDEKKTISPGMANPQAKSIVGSCKIYST